MLPPILKSFPLLYLAKEDFSHCGLHYSTFISSEVLQKAAEEFLDAGYHLEDICGMDTAEFALVTYHFNHFNSPLRIALRICAPHDDPTFPSISKIYQGAEWHERETKDFFGYTFSEISNQNPLLIDYNMREILPLRKLEEARTSIQQLLNTVKQEVLFCDESFSLMDAPVDDSSEETQSAT